MAASANCSLENFSAIRRLTTWPSSHVGDRDLGVVGHAAEEDRPAAGEGPDERRLAVVPLAGRERRVAGLAQHLRQERHAVEVVRDVEPGAAAHQHGAARHADGAAVRAEAVVAAEAGPAPDEPVEVRRPDVRVAPRRDGVGALVVGEQEQDVRPRRPLPREPEARRGRYSPPRGRRCIALGRTRRVEGSALASMILPLRFPAPTRRPLVAPALRDDLLDHIGPRRRSGGSRGPGSGTSAARGRSRAGGGSSPAGRGRGPCRARR